MYFLNSDSPAIRGEAAAGTDKTNWPGDHKNMFMRGGNYPDVSASEYASITWDYLFNGNKKTPDTILPVQPVDLKHFNSGEKSQLKITWLGHSSLMIYIDGYKILTDPVFEKKITLLGPSRFNGDIPVDIEKLPPIDAVVISHDHYDHLNKFSIRHLNEKTKKFFVPLKVGTRIADWGIPKHKIIEMDWWDEYHIDNKLKFVATPAQHFSGRFLFDRNKTLWASWVITAPTHKIFFSGDSGYFEGFKKIGDMYGPFDITFIECGAYNKAWDKVHMFPEQTVQAHLDLKGKILHPIHWGTFNLSLHSWNEPMKRLSAAAENHNITLATPVAGGTTIYNDAIASIKWWLP